MKINSLSFSNINSLAGVWSIDFEAPAFSYGLFALTGATGAGKTSVLDAICLALYGQTVREKISKEHNEVMTRGTGQCYAEVVIRIENHCYRCRWSQNRARNKPDGVLQSAEREIADASSGVIIASQVRLVEAKIVELTGMSFDQFTRAVLLAQGQFDTFLKAKDSERADILEKITNTGIYSEIGATVFARFQEEKRKKEDLERDQESIAIMTREDRDCLDNKLAEAKTRQTAAVAELECLRKQMEWLDNINKLKNAQENLAQQRADLDRRLAGSKPDLDKLHRAESARRFDVELEAIKNAHEAHANAQKQISGRQLQAEECRKNLTHATSRLAVTAQSVEAAGHNKEKARPRLAEIRRLDKQIGLAEQEKISANAILDSAKHHHNEALDLLSRAQQSCSAAESEYKSAVNYQHNHADDGKIVDLLRPIEVAHGSWNTLLRNVIDAQARVSECEKSAAGAAKKAEAALTAQKADKRAAAKAKADYEAQTPILKEAQSDKDEAEADKLKAQTDLDSQKPVFEKQLKLVDRAVRLAQQAIDLEQARKQLMDGKPCPLCGAIDHPYARGNAPKLSVAEKEQRTIRLKIDKLEKRAKDAREKYEAADKTLREMQKYVDQLARVSNGANNRVKLSAQASQAAVDTAKTTKEQVDNAKELAKAAADKAKKAWSCIATKLNELGVIKPTAENWGRILKDLKIRQSDYETQTKHAQKSSVRIVEAKKAIAEANRRVKKASETLSAKQDEFNIKAKALNDLVKERVSKHGKLDPEAEENRLQAAKEEADSSHRDAEKTKAALEQAATGAAKEVKVAQLSLEKAEISLQEAVVQGTGKWKYAGFVDEIDCRNARCTDAEVERLGTIRKSLADEDAELKTNVKTYAALLATEQAKSMTDRPAADLAADLDSKQTDRAKEDEILREIELKVGMDEANRVRQAAQGHALETQKVVFLRWDKLNDMIGTAGGVRFKKYAQGITLNRLLKVANPYLDGMTNNRYALQWNVKDGDDLLPSIIDNYQAEATRPTSNLSGGETFMVSLALALGLSGMASGKLRVDSLFLDEGFGTLDNDALDRAIGILNQLHQSHGKLIGVISHIDQLKNQIGTKIEVTKVGNGRSKLTGSGVVHISSSEILSPKEEGAVGDDDKPRKRGRPSAVPP